MLGLTINGHFNSGLVRKTESVNFYCLKTFSLRIYGKVIYNSFCKKGTIASRSRISFFELTLFKNLTKKER